MSRNSAEIVDYINTCSDAEFSRILSQLVLQEDFEEYCKHVLKVQTIRGKIVPFVLNGPQKILHEIIENHIKPRRLVRIVALKARRMGFTTYISARMYRYTSSSHNKYAMQIAHEPDASDFIFKMVKRFYNLSPAHLRPETLYNNARLLEFNKPNGMGLNSAIRIATAGKDDVGSGQLIHLLHFSEAAKYPGHNIKDLMNSIFPCVPDSPDTEVYFESTAKGVGGEFYDRFWNSRYRYFISKIDQGKPVIQEVVNEKASEDNIFTSVFLPWFCFEDYHVKPMPDFIPSDKEKALAEQYGLNEGQLAWRRWAVANVCNNSEEVFMQEFPSNPMEAFLGTGRPVFADTARLMTMSLSAPPPIARYESLGENWVASPKGRLRVWEEPKVGEHYVIAADVAEGLESGDFSCADVVNHRTGQQVAQWHGNLDADNVFEFGDILASLGYRYNTALIAPERNNHGISVTNQLCMVKYPRIHAEMVPDPPGKPRKRYGWVTSRVSRNLIIDNMIKEMCQGTHGIVCKETFEEMMTFKVQDNGKTCADEGCYDDRVMSYSIAKHICATTPIPTFVHRGRGIHGQNRIAAPTPPPKQGWT